MYAVYKWRKYAEYMVCMFFYPIFKKLVHIEAIFTLKLVLSQLL